MGYCPLTLIFVGFAFSLLAILSDLIKVI